MSLQTEGLIDFAALQAANLHKSPFPYVIVPDFIKPKYLSGVIESFPDIQHRGSIPAGLNLGGHLFNHLLFELEDTQLRTLIAEKFALDLNKKPVMTTLRAATSEKDGRIHTDSKSKLITLLLFLNPIWPHEGGRLRLLHSKNSLEDYFEEIPPVAGLCLIFKVVPNGWHGHKPFIGKRLSLQLNYLHSEARLTKHLNHHRFTAALKRWFPKLFYRDENY